MVICYFLRRLLLSSHKICLTNHHLPFVHIENCFNLNIVRIQYQHFCGCPRYKLRKFWRRVGYFQFFCMSGSAVGDFPRDLSLSLSLSLSLFFLSLSHTLSLSLSLSFSQNSKALESLPLNVYYFYCGFS